MKKILGLTVAALLVMGLVGGGTWAYFSDTETSSGNQFLAGTLDLGLAKTSGTNPVASITGSFVANDTFAPGDAIDATIFVNNAGTIAMASVNLTITNTGVIDGTPTSVDDYNAVTDNDNLLKMIKIKTLKYGTIGAPTEINTYDGLDLTQLATSPIALGALGAETEQELYIEFEFSPSADNGCQGDSANITLTFSGLQQ
jgi:spore coat-associated protein N